MDKKTISVLGAGSWGTAVAIHLAQVGHRVLLWGRDTQQNAHMLKERENTRFLPNITFPSTLTPTTDFELAVSEAEYLIIAVPSHAFAEVLAKINQPLQGITWVTKGVDPLNNALLSELIGHRFGHTFPMAMVSGPSFAKEVATFLPTALTLAGNDLEYQSRIHQLFHHNNIRVYLSDDLIGVQLCGAVKNVLAIACGISDGLGYGANAKAALITRGLAEMSRLGLALGAKQDTFLGLAGVGDLVLTCTDNQSRNRRFGLLLGHGVGIDEAEQQIGQVVEGKHNAGQVCAIAKQLAIEMPICEQVYAVLQGTIDASHAVKNLMSRPPRGE